MQVLSRYTRWKLSDLWNPAPKWTPEDVQALNAAWRPQPMQPVQPIPTLESRVQADKVHLTSLYAKRDELDAQISGKKLELSDVETMIRVTESGLKLMMMKLEADYPQPAEPANSRLHRLTKQAEDAIERNLEDIINDFDPHTDSNEFAEARLAS